MWKLEIIRKKCIKERKKERKQQINMLFSIILRNVQDFMYWKEFLQCMF